LNPIANPLIDLLTGIKIFKVKSKEEFFFRCFKKFLKSSKMFLKTCLKSQKSFKKVLKKSKQV